MWIITILMLLVAAAFFSYLWKEDFYDTLPMATALLILLLYILAFFGKLSSIDIISIVFAGFFCILLFFMKKERRKDIVVNIGKTLGNPKCLVMLIVMGTVTFLVKDRIAVWWDDINFWAADAKSLYYLNGFASKYGNVAPEFGDYPPTLSLFKWWFLHFNSDGFKEGLMFAAYYCLNLIFLMPLLRKLKTRNPLLLLIGFIGLFLMPGMVDSVFATGTCADVTMGIVYGAFLWAAFDDKGHTVSFYYIRLGLYLCILVLVKSVGIEWACFGILFFLLLLKQKRKEETPPFLGKRVRYIVGVAAAAILAEGSWLAFCLTHRRVAKLTSAGVKMAVGGNYTLPGNTLEKMSYYLRGFSMHPMHAEKTWGIDLSSLVLLILVIAVIIIFARKKILCQQEKRRLLLFTILTAFAAYGIIFIGHITIFAGELQYLDAAVMAISIARYGAPFSIGMIYLLAGIFLERTKDTVKSYLICLAIVLATTYHPGIFYSVYNYHAALAEEKENRDNMIEENAQLFLQKVAETEELTGKRTLYLRNDKEIHWVKDTYISYEASPAAVVYGGIATDTMDEGTMEQKIRESHAEFLYVDRVEGDPTPLFAGMLNEEPFEYETVYRVLNDNGKITLIKY
ncbi:MAG: hypothetical protein PUB13_01500 [Lachnospiraceae bacterium]|nr:hypothetical protein [Lachnospiraceae bacterium]